MNMKHEQNDVDIIMSFVNNNDGDLTIKDIALFIKNTFGISWSTTDKQTVAYLQEFIDNKN